MTTKYDYLEIFKKGTPSGCRKGLKLKDMVRPSTAQFYHILQNCHHYYLLISYLWTRSLWREFQKSKMTEKMPNFARQRKFCKTLSERSETWRDEWTSTQLNNNNMQTQIINNHNTSCCIWIVGGSLLFLSPALDLDSAYSF